MDRGEPIDCTMGKVSLARGTIVSTEVLVETPESIDLQAEPAGIVVRGLAFSIDLLIRGMILMVLSIVLGLAGKAGAGIVLIAWFLLEWFYPVYFEVYRQGQTPGKKKLGLSVVNDDLTPIGWGTSVIRNLLRWADFFPVLYTAGMATMACNKKFQRLGDIAAGTLVVYRQADPQPAQLSTAKAQPPPVALEREDQIAIIGFAQRHRQLSDDRQQELAGILGPLLPVDSAHRVGCLRGIGHWLLGDR